VLKIKSANKPFLRDSARILITPLIVITISVITISSLSPDPAETLYYFFTSPFSTNFFFGNMLNTAGLLIIAALGVTVVFKAGMFNLGGEGQVYAGAFTATAAALMLPEMNPPLAIIIILICGSLTGAGAGFISGYLKNRWDTNELISSFLLSSALIHIVNYFITGRMADKNSYLITTEAIDKNYRLMQLLPPSKLNVGFFLAVLTALVSYLYLYKTAGGFELRETGKNRIFAWFSGIKTGYFTVFSFTASGALHGFTGGLAATGTYYMCSQNCTAGLGWSAIAVALIARNNPLYIIPSALFISFMNTGMSGITMYTNFPFELSSIIQAVVFFFITTTIIKKGGSNGSKHT
jgi:simple sugar transport system permease protein